MGNLVYPSVQKDASMHPRYGRNKNCSPSNSVVDQSSMSHVFLWYLPFPMTGPIFCSPHFDSNICTANNPQGWHQQTACNHVLVYFSSRIHSGGFLPFHHLRGK
ncbi:hypothetical protein AMECASPLE_036204 [Ameca splendens]|uniref:Uncharacterized protein n=1 Tax=Ameca splendens TaxID=208324 RepID=A0ABV0YUR5_9TELE